MLLAALASAADLQADLHLDTPTQLLRRKVGFDAPGLESGLDAMRAGGTNLAVMVLWPPRGAGEAHVDALLATLEAEDTRLEAIELVRDPDAARQVAGEGRVAMLYALEGAHGIEAEGLDGLRRLHARGLSLLGLTWSVSNRFAGSSGDGGGGLTEAGRALVDEAVRLGVMIDLSHASRTTTLEVCGQAKAPVIASHSDAAAVTPHARNLSDEEIRCIAATGGVVGLNLHSTFVGRPADVRKLADHLDHLKKIGGVGVLALGSDFDGLIDPPDDLPTAAELPKLWEELRRRGYSETELSMIRAENFLRAWAACRSIAGLP